MRRLLIFSAAFLAAGALNFEYARAQGRGAAGGRGATQGFGQAGGLGGGQAGSFGQSGGLGGGGFGASAGGGVGGGSTGMSRSGSVGVFGNRSVGGGTTSQRAGFSGVGGGQQGGRFSSMGIADPSQMFQAGGRAQATFTGAQAGGQNANALGGLATGLAMSGLQNLRANQGQGRGNRGQQQQGGRQGGNRNGRQGQERTVRTVLTLGFQVTPRSQPALASTVAQRLANSRGVDAMSPMTVTMQDRTAVLRGVVPTDHARTLAEQLALLEPGVSRVQNELTVAPVTTAGTAEATATAAPPPRSTATVRPGPVDASRAAR